MPQPERLLTVVSGGATDRRVRGFRYRVGVVGDDDVIGDDPLVNGMSLSVRLRRDFTVTDADRLLTTARRTYRELNPGASAEEAGEMVSCAAVFARRRCFRPSTQRRRLTSPPPTTGVDSSNPHI
jgi:hypothetical protein